VPDRNRTLPLILSLVLCIAGRADGQDAKDAKAAGGKVPADAARITAMLRERFGAGVADAVRVKVAAAGGSVKVSLRGELPDEKTRTAVMNEVSDRVEGLQQEDFALTVAGPVRLMHTEPVRVRYEVPIAFSKDGRFAALLEREFGTATFEIWDLPARRRLNRPDTHDLPVIESLAISDDGRLLAVGHGQGVITIWRMPMGEHPVMLRPADPVDGEGTRALAFSPDGRTLASVGLHKSVPKLWLWDLSALPEPPAGAAATDKPALARVRSRMVGELKSSFSTFFLAFSPDGKTLAAAGRGVQEIGLWDVASRSLRTTLKHEKLVLEALAWSPDGKTLAAGRMLDNGGIALFDPAGSGEPKVLPFEDRDLLEALAFSPDGKTLVSRHTSGGLVLWDPAAAAAGAGKPWMTVPTERCGHGGPTMAFSADGTALVAGADTLEGWGLRWWDVSARPGAVRTPAAKGPDHAPVPRDDYLRAEVSRFIGRRVGQGTAGVKVDVTADGTIRLSGTVADRRVSEDVERDVFIRFCHYRNDDDPPRKVANDIKVGG
jgi:hypothetical protein